MPRRDALPRSKFVTSKVISLREFHEKHHKILIMRKSGGLGDILMMRMIFEDFKQQNKDAHITFACPERYHEIADDHPFVDAVIDWRAANISDYAVSYDVSIACEKYETKTAPYIDKHRADIWANRCGVELKSHKMHLHVDPQLTAQCKERLEEFRQNEKGPIVLFCPISTMPSRNLNACQANGVIDGLKDMDCAVVCSHEEDVNYLNAPTIVSHSFTELMGFINASDYIVSVDTGTFHAAGGLDKPMVGIFAWADGKMRGKWFDRWILVQRHRDNGNWDCGPCFLWSLCPKTKPGINPKPCITELTAKEIVEATKQMMDRWPIQ